MVFNRMNWNRKTVRVLAIFLAASQLFSDVWGVNVVWARSGPNSGKTKALRTGEVLLRLKDNPKIYKIKVPVGDIDKVIGQFKKSGLVETVEANQFFKASFIPDDQLYVKQLYHNQIFSQDVWDRTQGSNKVIIAVVDSGVDIRHPDLVSNIWINTDEIAGDNIDNDNNGFIDDVNGWDFVTSTPDPNPKSTAVQIVSSASSAAVSAAGNDLSMAGGPIGLNHGTVVAGVAAARGNNREGIAGVSWNSQIMPVRILDTNGFGDTLNVVKGMDYALSNGAHIINLSFVGFDSSPLMDEAILRAYNSNVVVVAAAGNDPSNSGTNLDLSPGFPVCSGVESGQNLLLGVAAVDYADRRARFTNYGSKCVDISAPGVNIFSAQAQVTSLGLFDLYGDGWSGTSLATPLISGGAALLKALKPSLTNKEIMELLINSTDSIDGLNPDFAGKIGRGRINLFRAALAALDPSSILPAPPSFQSPGTPVVPTSPVMLNLPSPSLQDKSIVTVPAGLYNSSVQIYDLESGIKIRTFPAFPTRFAGGLNIAVGDLESDGSEEILVAPGEGGSPQVKIFDTAGKLKTQFAAGPAASRSGANLVLADVDKDFNQEIIMGLGRGAPPLVKIFNQRGELRKEFLAYPKKFLGGVNVAAADLDNDGSVEILTAPGKGIIGTIKIFDTEGNLKGEFLPFANFLGGLRIAVTDMGADGFTEVIVGPGAGGGPQIKIFNSALNLIAQFFAFENQFRGGIFLSGGNIVENSGDEIIVGTGLNSQARVRVFDGRGQKELDFSVYPASYRGGVRVQSLNEKIITK